MVVVPSRIGVVQYDLMKRQIEELVGKINGRFGRVGWTPVVYQYRHVPFASLAALYAVSDVCLVTPLRDGMNLVAKEYVATRADGGVLDSERNGRLRQGAAGGDHYQSEQSRRKSLGALKEALRMPLPEQQKRHRLMQRRLQALQRDSMGGRFSRRIWSACARVQSRIECKRCSRRRAPGNRRALPRQPPPLVISGL